MESSLFLMSQCNSQTAVSHKNKMHGYLQPPDIKDILVADKGENNMQNEVFTFLSIGSLIPVKNFTALIQAASIVKKSNQEFKVVILGKGALEADLRKEISVLDLEDYVELRGYVRTLIH